MKLLNVLSIFFIILISSALGQRRQRCAGRPRNPSCTGARDIGRRGFRCTTRNMFYYDAAARRCRQMRYRGCGGNNNRWCSRAQCQQRCNR